MHEMSLAQNLLEIVRQEMHKHGVERLLKVKLKTGRLTAVVPEVMSTAFEALIKDTPLQGADLEIETIPLTLACGNCRHQFSAEGDETLFFTFPCPVCGRDSGHSVLSGREFSIDYIDAE
ncbi:MAG: hydrogenase maturation nickel metallochaperone HypA [Desulfohalobiaceae bacterium]|nr:hydrogenase maturation nickel metallochaperone HypA [Desulfohalobiaceae bacterium]